MTSPVYNEVLTFLSTQKDASDLEIRQAIYKWDKKYPKREVLKAIVAWEGHNRFYESKASLRLIAPLVEKGLGLNSAMLSSFYLRIAIEQSNLDLCKQILEKSCLSQKKIDECLVVIQIDYSKSVDHNPLSWAVANAKPECVALFAERGAKTGWEGADPFLNLPDRNVDYVKLVETFDALIKAGIYPTNHSALCEKILFAPRNIYALLDQYVEAGLDLDAVSSETGYTILVKWLELKDIEEAPHHIWKYVDRGAAMPDDFRQKTLQQKYTEHGPVAKYAPLSLNDKMELAFWPNEIPRFLQTMSPETLVCRCSSFGILDGTGFMAILEKANEQLQAEGKPALTADELFARLPPFLQKSDRMIDIRQAIKRRNEADITGLGDISAVAKSKTREVE